MLVVHFAVRKPLIESYTQRYGWIVNALCIPAAFISIILMSGGKSAAFWASGFVFVHNAAFGLCVGYIAMIEFRKSLNLAVMIPYVTLYLATVMFYWWPLLRLSRPLRGVYTVLYVIAMVLNIRSH